MKIFRIKLRDGSSINIEANNEHDARTIAHMKFGALPNDINQNISKNLVSNIQGLITELTTNLAVLRQNSKDLKWNETYVLVNKLASSSTERLEMLKQLAGSMEKIMEDAK